MKLLLGRTAGTTFVDSDELPEGQPFSYEVTATLQYDLWKNVVSRVEFRWDHSDNGKLFGANATSTSSVAATGGSRRNAFMLAAQVIYKF